MWTLLQWCFFCREVQLYCLRHQVTTSGWRDRNPIPFKCFRFRFRKNIRWRSDQNPFEGASVSGTDFPSHLVKNVIFALILKWFWGFIKILIRWIATSQLNSWQRHNDKLAVGDSLETGLNLFEGLQSDTCRNKHIQIYVSVFKCFQTGCYSH